MSLPEPGSDALLDEQAKAVIAADLPPKENPMAAKYEIPVGLATKLGMLAAGISGAIAGVTAVLHGDHTETTIAALLTSGALIYGVVHGRMKQAVELVKHFG